MHILLGLYWIEDKKQKRNNDFQANLGEVRKPPTRRELERVMFAAKMELIRQLNARKKQRTSDKGGQK